MKTPLTFILTTIISGLSFGQVDSLRFADLKGSLPIPVDNYLSFESCCADLQNLRSLADPIENQLQITCDSNATALSWASGQVEEIFQMDGYWVVLVSHDNYMTVYYHLENLQVKVGDPIHRRQPLGMVANVNGQHELIIELWDKTTQKQLDPLEWLEQK